ncbi:hypothetical protein [Helcococcus bovis]|uniref:hypothetical protein n=1 Tax=Helcococcus bovis TaxID=3153252 RepID=UPI0038B89EBD
MKKIKKLSLLLVVFTVLFTSCGVFGQKTPKQIQQNVMNYYKDYKMIEANLSLKQKNKKIKNIEDDLKADLKIDSNKKVFANLQNKNFSPSVYFDFSKLNSVKFYINMFGQWNKTEQDLTQMLDQSKISGKTNEDKILTSINQLFERKVFTVLKENSNYVLSTNLLKIKEELAGDFEKDPLKKDEVFNEDNKVEIKVDASNYSIKEIKVYNKDIELNISEVKKVNGEVKLPNEALNGEEIR